MGNVKSVQNALELLGESAVISDDIKIISESDAIVLPGVGSFSDQSDESRVRFSGFTIPQEDSCDVSFDIRVAKAVKCLA